MRFEDVCLISEDVRRLAGFYEAALGQGAQWEGDEHASISVSGRGLSIYAKAAAERDMGFSFPNWGSGNVVLGFHVGDVDAEYARLRALGVEFMTEPRTYPWGARSVHFRDPDGNIVCLRCRTEGAP